MRRREVQGKGRGVEELWWWRWWLRGGGDGWSGEFGRVGTGGGV